MVVLSSGRRYLVGLRQLEDWLCCTNFFAVDYDRLILASSNEACRLIHDPRTFQSLLLFGLDSCQSCLGQLAASTLVRFGFSFEIDRLDIFDGLSIPRTDNRLMPSTNSRTCPRIDAVVIVKSIFQLAVNAVISIRPHLRLRNLSGCGGCRLLIVVRCGAASFGSNGGMVVMLFLLFFW
jgi:hypothetical protein